MKVENLSKVTRTVSNIYAIQDFLQALFEGHYTDEDGETQLDVKVSVGGRENLPILPENIDKVLENWALKSLDKYEQTLKELGVEYTRPHWLENL